MARPAGNRRLKAARLAKGYGSQRALADALNVAASDLGLRGVSIGERQVRRWESESPPWPQSHHQRVLTHVLGFGMDELGLGRDRGHESLHAERFNGGRGEKSWWHCLDEISAHRADTPLQDPSSVAASCAQIAAIRRRLYWVAEPTLLHNAVVEDIGLGRRLLAGTTATPRGVLARALAESSLLAGRIEFFDLNQPDVAAESFVRALQFAGEADDYLLGAAILAHAAFIPGWTGDREGASDRLAAARSHARRADASGLMWAWIDAVDAECAALSNDTSGALALINRAESYLNDYAGLTMPDWMDWFSPARLAAFKGSVQLKAGHLRRAEESLTNAITESPLNDTKQRAVILADIAAVKLGQNEVQACCDRLNEALDNLVHLWYATAMDRIQNVRRGLRPWQNEMCVRALDERLYDWTNTINVLRR